MHHREFKENETFQKQCSLTEVTTIQNDYSFYIHLKKMRKRCKMHLVFQTFREGGSSVLESL
jgi:hypothetical protein